MINSYKTSLLQKFQDRTAIVAILGLGYVGLPLAVVFAEAGFKVIGIDPVAEKVDAINRGASYVLLLFPTGPGVKAWSRDAEETWRGFSPRKQEILPPPQPLKSRAAPSPDAVKLATITIQSSSPQAGDLTSTHAVWSDQLERGILVGRDDRCSHGGVDEGNLSRVHLVLLSVDDEVWAIDTASTNGTRVLQGAPFRQLLLSGDTHLLLADALSLRWAPAVHAARA